MSVSGILRSLKKIVFAEDIFYGRIVRGSFENGEYYSQKGVLVRDKNRKDRGIRLAFKRAGYKAPNLDMPLIRKGTENQNNRQQNISWKKHKFGSGGVLSSLQKEVFAKDIFYDRIVRGSFENGEYYSQKGVLVRDKNRKDHGIRLAFKRAGYKAPNLAMPCDSEGTRDQRNRQQNIKNVYQARTLGDER